MENQYMYASNTNNNDEIEIDLREIFALLISRLWIIILAGVTAALIFIVVTILFISPQYESTTKMYVLNRQDNNTLTQADMQASLYLTKDYAKLIESRTVMEGVIAQLNLDMTSEELLRKMTIENDTDTRVLGITIKDGDPYVASQIADAVRDIAATHIQNVMDIEAVNVVETANIPDRPSSPSLMKNALIGGALGVVLAVAVIMLVYLTNDTVKTQEDVEKYLGLSVLGTIPLMETERKSKKRKTRGRRK